MCALEVSEMLKMVCSREVTVIDVHNTGEAVKIPLSLTLQN